MSNIIEKNIYLFMQLRILEGDWTQKSFAISYIQWPILIKCAKYMAKNARFREIMKMVGFQGSQPMVTLNIFCVYYYNYYTNGFNITFALCLIWIIENCHGKSRMDLHITEMVICKSLISLYWNFLFINCVWRLTNWAQIKEKHSYLLI